MFDERGKAELADQPLAGQGFDVLTDAAEVLTAPQYRHPDRRAGDPVQECIHPACAVSCPNPSAPSTIATAGAVPATRLGRARGFTAPARTCSAYATSRRTPCEP